MTEHDGETWESASLRCESTRALRLVKTSAFSAAMRQTSPQLIDCACLPIGYANGEMSAIFPCQIVRTTLPNGPQKRLPVEQAAWPDRRILFQGVAPRWFGVENSRHAAQADPRITLQKLPRLKVGSLSARTSVLTLPNVVSGLRLMPS
jgi:hypothetical protein